MTQTRVQRIRDEIQAGTYELPEPREVATAITGDPQPRPRLSREFIQENQRRRLIDGAARSFVERGYPGTTVADIVKETGVARNTFYDNFGSKEAAALSMLSSVCPTLEIGNREPVEADGAILLAIDIGSRIKAGDLVGASALAADAESLLAAPVKVEPFEPTGTEDEPRLAQLPPGRHGLPPGFVRENQLTRLLAGTADAIYEAGYAKATIADITRLAAVSRRTFYEHFDGKQEAAEVMLARAEEQGAPRDGHPLASGFGHLWAEIVASAFAGDEMGSENRRRGALAIIRMLATQLDVAEAA